MAKKKLRITKGKKTKRSARAIHQLRGATARGSGKQYSAPLPSGRPHKQRSRPADDSAAHTNDSWTFSDSRSSDIAPPIVSSSSCCCLVANESSGRPGTESRVPARYDGERADRAAATAALRRTRRAAASSRSISSSVSSSLSEQLSPFSEGADVTVIATSATSVGLARCAPDGEPPASTAADTSGIDENGAESDPCIGCCCVCFCCAFFPHMAKFSERELLRDSEPDRDPRVPRGLRSAAGSSASDGRDVPPIEARDRRFECDDVSDLFEPSDPDDDAGDMDFAGAATVAVGSGPPAGGSLSLPVATAAMSAAGGVAVLVRGDLL
eukprot:Opistho-1_new@10273